MKSSWSLGDMMRRIGCRYWWTERSGGEGRGGVVGVISREVGVALRVFDRSSDSLLERSTFPVGDGKDACDAIVLVE